MRIQYNAGIRMTNLVGDLPGYGPVWFDSRAIVNAQSEAGEGKISYRVQQQQR